MRKDCTKAEGWKKAHKKVKRIRIKKAKENRIQYYQNPKLCENCNFPIEYEKRKDNKFCSRSCAAIINGHKYPKRVCEVKERNCLNCNTLFKYYHKPYKKENIVHCSKACQKMYNEKSLEQRFLNGEITYRKTIKSVLINKYGHRCDICNKTKWMKHPIPLEVDHIDGDATNNKPENLRKICPNCHAQTPTWKGKNLGNGRGSRGVSLG